MALQIVGQVGVLIRGVIDRDTFGGRDADRRARREGTEAGREFGEGFNRESRRQAESGVRRLRNLIGTVVAAAATRKVASFLQDSITLAGEAEDSISALQTAYGTAGQKIVEWADEQAAAFNVSRREAYTAGQTFANFGKIVGAQGDELAAFSTSLVERAAEVANFYGGTTQEAITAFGAALRGEMDPIERYSVLLGQSALEARALADGIIEKGEKLEGAKKVQVVYNEILEQTSAAQGDVARTADSYNTKLKDTQQRWADAKEAIGQRFLPAAGAALDVINATIPALDGMVGGLQEVGEYLAENEEAIIAVTVALGVLNSSKISTSIINGLGFLVEKAKAAKTAIDSQGGITGSLKKLGAAGAVGAVAAIGYAAFQAEREADALNDTITELLTGNRGDNSLADQLEQAAEAAEKLEDAARGALEHDNIIDWFTDAPAAMAEAIRLLGDTETNLERSMRRAEDVQERFENLAVARTAMLDRIYEDTGKLVGWDTIDRLFDNSAVQASDSWEVMIEKVERFRTTNEKVPAAVQNTEEAIDDLADVSLTAEERVKALDNALDGLLGMQNNVAKVTAAVHAAIDGLTKEVVTAEAAFNKKRTAVNLNTEAGRDLQSAVINSVEALAELAGTTFHVTGSQDKATAAYERGREKLLKQMQQAGLTRKEAERLADQYGATPDLVETAFKVPGLDEATVKVDELGRKIQQLPDGKEIVFSMRTSSQLSAINRDRRPRGRWTGGKMTGPGTDTSDSIPALLSNNEWVIRASSARKYGDAFLGALNAGRIDPRDLPRYADGGPVRRDVVLRANRFRPEDFMHHVSDGLARLAAAAEQQGRRELARLANPAGWVRPVGGYRVSSEYGPRGSGFHAGIDLAVPIGRPVRAPFPGVFRAINLGDRSYGKYADLRNGPYRVIMAHLDGFARGPGMAAHGEVLGYSGSSGNSTGPHVHFEVRQGGSALNPRRLMRFDTGGRFPEGTLAHNYQGGVERILTERQNRSFERLVEAVDRSGSAAGQPPVHFEAHYHEVAAQSAGEIAHRTLADARWMLATGAAAPLTVGAPS